MNAKDAIFIINNAVKSALKLNLDYGETCPFCGHKKQNKRIVTEKMLAANRRNQKKAVEAIRAK